MGRIGPLEVAKNSLDLAFLGQRDGQVDMKPDYVAIQMRRRKQAAERIHATASRMQPAPEQCNERDSAGAGVVEARGFRSTRIDCRHWQALGNVAERVRIAYREIVQSALHARVPANGKVRLVSVNVKRGPVNTADAEPLVSGCARWQRHRKIVLACFRAAGPRV